MKLLNETQFSRLTPVGRGTPRARARGKIGKLKVGQGFLFGKDDQKKLGDNVRNLTWGLDGKFSVKKFKEGVAVQRIK